MHSRRAGERALLLGLGGGGLVAKSCSTLAILWTVACQAPLSMGFSRQEYWSGLPCPSLPERVPNIHYILLKKSISSSPSNCDGPD